MVARRPQHAASKLACFCAVLCQNVFLQYLSNLMVGAVETNKINVYSMCIRCGINVRRDYRCNILQYYISVHSSVLFVIGASIFVPSWLPF